MNDRPYTFDRVARIGILAALIWGTIWLLGTLSDVLIPFATALLLAYLIHPLVARIESRVHRRGPAVALALIGALGTLALAAWLLAPIITGAIARTGRVVTDLVNNSEIAARAAERLPPDLWETARQYAAREEVQAFFRTDSAWALAQTVGDRLLPGVWGIISGTASFLMGLVGLTVIGLYLVFLLLDYESVGPAWRGPLPPAWKEPVVRFVEDFDEAMNRYFRAQATVAAIVGVLFAVGFSLIGLPMGILLGLFIGLLNMVPYLQIVGLIPAFLLAAVHALETGTGFPVMLGLTAAVFVVVQTIQDAILVPRIMGKVTGLNPAVILLSLSVWGKLLGLFGLLVAIPITCLLLAWYRRFVIRDSPR